MNEHREAKNRVQVVIEPIAPEQIDSFHAAFDMVARERCFLTFLEAPPIEETRQFVLGSIAKGNPHVVALVDQIVVGWCDISRHFFPSHAHRGSVGMGLIPEFRGRGLGLRLIDAALQQAWELGLSRVELSVHADNTAAITLYEKVGFKREGLIRDAFFADGVYRDAIAMAIIQR